MASPLVVYAAASDGFIQSTNAAYATAAAGGTMSSNTSASIDVGIQDKWNGSVYTERLSYFNFDTSAIPDTDTAGTPVFALLANSWGYDQNFVLQLRAYDWGDTLATADWIPLTNLSALTLLATYDPAANGWPTGTRFDFVSEAAFAGYINKTGLTRCVLCSDDQAAGTTPGAENQCECGFASSGTAGNRPLLTVPYSTPATSSFIPGIMQTHFIPSLGG